MATQRALPTSVLNSGVLEAGPSDMFVTGRSKAEDRFALPVEWEDFLSDSAATVLSVARHSDDAVTFLCGKSEAVVALNDASALRSVFKAAAAVWLDITPLDHAVWAPIVRVVLEARIPLQVIYSEPASYAAPSGLTTGLRYELSKSIGSIAPLPGFARLRAFDEGSNAFIPLLGFEGNRLAHAMESTQATPTNTFPIVGLPGFRPDYPFVSLSDNYRMLNNAPIPSQMQYARAYCPFDAFHAIEQAHELSGFEGAQVAPIGTKPHGLGAVLYAIANSARVELIYDHPTKAADRTLGRGRTWIYNVSLFMDNL